MLLDLQDQISINSNSDKIKVLIVEDNIDTQALLMAVLDGSYEVQVASTGAEALSLIDESTPQIVLLDLTLPDMSGEDVMRHLREHPGRTLMKVLICSGWDDLPNRALTIGADGSITKPYDILSITQKISDIASTLQMSH